MYKEQGRPCPDMDYREEGVVCDTKHPPYCDEIHVRISNLQELSRSIKDKTKNLSGGRPQEVGNLPKETEPYNFGESVIRDLDSLSQTINDIYDDISRFI